jgi:hypothetical protein
MACCHGDPSSVKCDYGERIPPQCPPTLPIDGEPCSELVGCWYYQPERDPGCEEAVAYCTRAKTWNVWRSLGCQSP